MAIIVVLLLSVVVAEAASPRYVTSRRLPAAPQGAYAGSWNQAGQGIKSGGQGSSASNGKWVRKNGAWVREKTLLATPKPTPVVKLPTVATIVSNNAPTKESVDLSQSNSVEKTTEDQESVNENSIEHTSSGHSNDYDLSASDTLATGPSAEKIQLETGAGTVFTHPTLTPEPDTEESKEENTEQEIGGYPSNTLQIPVVTEYPSNSREHPEQVTERNPSVEREDTGGSGGYPSNPVVYPGGTGGYPSGGYPGGAGTYPSGGYPSGTGRYPSGGYPGGTGGHPPAGYHTGTGGFPSGGYPIGTGGYPSEGHLAGTGRYPSGHYPVGPWGYPSNPGSYPGGNGGYPSGGYPGLYPGGTQEYPQMGYPVGHGGYPANLRPYPGVTAGYLPGGYPHGTGGYPSGGYPEGTGTFPSNKGVLPGGTKGYQPGGDHGETQGYSSGGFPLGTGAYPSIPGGYPVGTGGFPSTLGRNPVPDIRGYPSIPGSDYIPENDGHLPIVGSNLASEFISSEENNENENDLNGSGNASSQERDYDYYYVAARNPTESVATEDDNAVDENPGSSEHTISLENNSVLNKPRSREEFKETPSPQVTEAIKPESVIISKEEYIRRIKKILAHLEGHLNGDEVHEHRIHQSAEFSAQKSVLPSAVHSTDGKQPSSSIDNSISSSESLSAGFGPTERGSKELRNQIFTGSQQSTQDSFPLHSKSSEPSEYEDNAGSYGESSREFKVFQPTNPSILPPFFENVPKGQSSISNLSTSSSQEGSLNEIEEHTLEGITADVDKFVDDLGRLGIDEGIHKVEERLKQFEESQNANQDAGINVLNKELLSLADTNSDDISDNDEELGSPEERPQIENPFTISSWSRSSEGSGEGVGSIPSLPDRDTLEKELAFSSSSVLKSRKVWGSEDNSEDYGESAGGGISHFPSIEKGIFSQGNENIKSSDKSGISKDSSEGVFSEDSSGSLKQDLDSTQERSSALLESEFQNPNAGTQPEDNDRSSSQEGLPEQTPIGKHEVSKIKSGEADSSYDRTTSELKLERFLVKLSSEDGVPSGSESNDGDNAESEKEFDHDFGSVEATRLSETVSEHKGNLVAADANVEEHSKEDNLSHLGLHAPVALLPALIPFLIPPHNPLHLPLGLPQKAHLPIVHHHGLLYPAIFHDPLLSGRLAHTQFPLFSNNFRPLLTEEKTKDQDSDNNIHEQITTAPNDNFENQSENIAETANVPELSQVLIQEGTNHVSSEFLGPHSPSTLSLLPSEVLPAEDIANTTGEDNDGSTGEDNSDDVIGKNKAGNTIEEDFSHFTIGKNKFGGTEQGHFVSHIEHTIITNEEGHTAGTKHQNKVETSEEDNADASSEDSSFSIGDHSFGSADDILTFARSDGVTIGSVNADDTVEDLEVISAEPHYLPPKDVARHFKYDDSVVHWERSGARSIGSGSPLSEKERISAESKDLFKAQILDSSPLHEVNPVHSLTPVQSGGYPRIVPGIHIRPGMVMVPPGMVQPGVPGLVLGLTGGEMLSSVPLGQRGFHPYVLK